MADLQVEIVTPERLIFSGRALRVSAPGWNGEFEIQPAHELYLSLLHGGTLTVVTDAGTLRFAIGRGFAEAGPDRVIILTERCVREGEADKARAQASIKAAEEELMVLNAYDEQALARIEEQLERARAELLL